MSVSMYDAVIIGAGISGSVCAKILAENGFKVVLLDRAVPPRDKVCSGVQQGYIEKIIGEKIPDDVLCSNKLRRVRLETPSGKSLEGGMPLLNYWRNSFDYWLNGLAMNAGAETRWDSGVSNLEIGEDSVLVKVGSDIVKARYVIGADGLSLNSFTRRWLSPERFSRNVTGASLNYYFKGDSSIKSDTLYIYYKKGFSDIMYSWLFYKDDIIVVGTSSTERLNHYAKEFLDTIAKKFILNAEKVGQDGYSTNSLGGVILGRDKVLLVGDAAGFLDLYRGVGMDSAALSGRICAQSLCLALKEGKDGLNVYRDRSARLVSVIDRNMRKQKERYISDKALDDSFSFSNIVKGTLIMSWANIWNRFCDPEQIILLPP